MARVKPTRRQVLKGASLAGFASSFSALSYGKVLGAGERVRVGFIGVGLIGKRHLLDFLAQPDVEGVAVCEVYQPRLEEGVALCEGRAKGYKDFRRVLDRKDCDAVVISTPDHWHALMTMMACAAGKDVYVEKPLTHVIREGRWMVDTASYHSRVVQVGTQQRSGEHYQKCRELVHNGHIGEIRNARVKFFRNILPGFTVPVGLEDLPEEDWLMWLGPAPYVPFDKNRCLYHFRWFWDYAGGQTTNLLSHDLDIVQWVTGQFPSTVSAFGARFSLTGIGETPDVIEAMFQYPRFVATWSEREVGEQITETREGLELCGTKGTLVINRRGFEIFPDRLISPEEQIPRFSGRRISAAAVLKQRTTELKMGGYEEVKDQFRPHVRNFLDCIKLRQQPISDLESGHRTVTSCHLANISMKIGRTLHWDHQKEEITGDTKAAEMLTKSYRSPWNRELAAVLPKL